MRYLLDRSVRRFGNGSVVVGGNPATLLRLTAAGARTVDRIGAGEDVAPTTLVQRLVARGMAHPQPGPVAEVSDLTVIVPTLDGRLDALLARLEGHRVIVVDDGSAPALRLAERPGLTVLRNEHPRGPAAARNQALALVDTELVAMVDDDVELPDRWDRTLAAHFADPDVVLCAPRIASAPGPDLRSRYEADRGALDLGPDPAPIRPFSRVSYVPAAVLMARTSAVRAAGGFDESLRYGEDVDLVWRLAEAGHQLRYEPAVVAHHAVRGSWGAWLRQRAAYGSSAAPLHTRHGAAVAPVVVSGWSAAAWGLVVAGCPVGGFVVAAGTTLRLERKLGDVSDARRVAIALAGRGHLGAGRVLAGGVTRAWWPLVALAALRSRTARRALMASAVVPAAVDWWHSSRRLDPVRFVALRIIDDAAYSVGVWRGCRRQRHWGALLPASMRATERAPAGGGRGPGPR